MPTLKPAPARRLAQSITRALSAAAFALAGCAAEDFSQPIPDEEISHEEVREGDQAVQAIRSGGNDPAHDNGQAGDETDGETAGLAPEQAEPTAAEQEADARLLAQPDDGRGEEIDASPAPLGVENDPDPTGAVSAERDTSSNVSELRRCRRASGYIRGRRYPICVTTINGKLVGQRTARAFVRMRAAARRQGIRIVVVSGFRTMAQQRYLYRLYRQGRGNLAAYPGYSNHQSGIALDLNTSAPGVYRFLARNGRRFGFVRTVPSEAWHWEYRR